MNNKKIIMTALGISVLSTVSILGATGLPSYASDGTRTIGNIVYSTAKKNIIKGTNRYKEGYFNGSVVMDKNPSVPGGAYVGSGSTYTKDKNQRVRSASIKGYGYTILYYAPYADGSGNNYTSIQADGVNENYYYKSGSGNSYLYSLNWSGSQDNFSYKDAEPNAGAKSSYPSAGTETSVKKDGRFNKTGQWRYLGYAIGGSAMSNPFFPADKGASNKHRSDVGILNQDIHGTLDESGNVAAKNKVGISRFDKGSYYEDKIKAIERLMKVDTRFKSGTIRQVDKGSSSDSERTIINNGKISAEVWANCLSLITDPTAETPVFKGHRASFTRYLDVVGITDKKLTNSLQIKSVIIRDSDDNLIKRFDRDENGETTVTGNGSVSPGQQVKVLYAIENTGDSATTVNPSKIQAGIAYGNNAYKNDYDNAENPYKYNSNNWVVAGGGVLEPGESLVLKETVTISSDASEAVRITAYVHQDYIDAGESGDSDDDWGHVIMNVKSGDTGLSNIQLIDKNGNVVKYMKPGEEYKTRYIFKYKGPDVHFQEYRWKSYWVTSGYTDSDGVYHDTSFEYFYKEYYDVWKDFTFSWTATRYLPGGGSELYRDSDVVSINKLANGTTWVYETPYFVYEVPKADASASLKTPSEVTDTDDSNNSGSQSWKFNYDIIVDNVRVYNKNERPIQNGTITIGLKYDVTLVTPTDFPYFETDVKTHVTLPNGQVLEFTDHLKQGDNKDITRELQVPVTVITSGSKQLNVTVFANADKKFWEKDLATQANNKDSGSTTQLPPVNPNQSDGCPLVNNSNSFTVTHSTNNYNGSIVKWSRFNNSASYSFYKYRQGSYSSVKNTYNESYTINSVKFKSKDTTDKNYGTNGWVDLTKASEKDKAIIKAGYGYELAIEVEYKNDALSRQPKAYDTRTGSTSSGKTVTNLSHKANVYKDIYVKTSDNKILSATGMYGTTSAFDITVVKSTDDTTVLRYTMKNTNQNGTSTPMKIYTSENAKDGSYGLKVWTPTITGVGNPKKSTDDLCDEEKLNFIIKGSMYDDNQDSVIQ